MLGDVLPIAAFKKRAWLTLRIVVALASCVAESKSSWIPNPVNPLDSSWIWFV
jgi:hypothetical protein